MDDRTVNIGQLYAWNRNKPPKLKTVYSYVCHTWNNKLEEIVCTM